MPSKTVECAEHGTRQATYVCQHLVQSLADLQPRGFWWADDPGNPYPHPWCSLCEEKVRSTNGEWTDESEAFAGVTLLCDQCYDVARELNFKEN